MTAMIPPRTLGVCPLCERPREWYAALDGWWCGETDGAPHGTYYAPAPLQLARMPAARRAKIMAAAGEDEAKPARLKAQRVSILSGSLGR